MDPAAKITAILLPGLHGTTELFKVFVAAAPTDIPVIAVTYPPEEIEYDRLEDVARAQITDSCLIIAESFSGPIGVRLSSDPRVLGLVLCNSFIRSPFPSVFRYLAHRLFFAAPLPTIALRLLLLGRTATRATARSTRAEIRRTPARVLAERTREVCKVDASRTLCDLRKPILYLRGEDDYLLTERGWRDLVAIRPDAAISRIRGPHMLLQAEPEACWKAIVEFIETLEVEA